ncbi:MAG TPA: alpha-L-glutamate ligase-like protein [Gemmataceae bacterium]|jgi:alpha-L-glutamate ligase-like protein|nr:alpha-L-glutamate ligase-like protein [Gemmataceae bacterium]
MNSLLNWLMLPFRLRARGVLGMNARNAGFILEQNPRALFPLVDDKLRFQELCQRIGVPSPTIFAIFVRHGDLRHLEETLVAAPDCVIKPARGSSGRGVVLLTGKVAHGWRRHNDSVATLDDVRRHVSDILSGLYSLGGRPDRALVQQRLRTHPELERISYRGTPDVRVLVYRGEPALAMLRLPTRQSGGRANLHQGGVGVGVDVLTGTTTLAVCRGRTIERHPDTGEVMAGQVVPDWHAVLAMAECVARATGLGYVGVDIVPEIDGPKVLEANARPGLAIQAANERGLRQVLEQIDAGHVCRAVQ